MKDQKKYNRELLNVEAVIGIAASIMTVAIIVLAATASTLADTSVAINVAMIVITVVSFVVICLALTKMEQIVGYYQCKDCRHKYVPSYSAVLWSMHIGRTRYLSCPKCHKKSWQKKVI